jgi:hypothetical protein
VTYRAPDVATTLRAAAHGAIPSEDPDAVMDPQIWIDAFVRSAASSPARDAVVEAIAQLLLADDEAEARLGATIQSKTVLVDAARVADGALKQSASGRFDTAANLLYSLIAAGAAGKAAYDSKLRGLASYSENRSLLISLLGDYDRPWLVDHAAQLLGNDSSEAVALVGAAARGLDAQQISTFAGELRASLDRFHSPVAGAVESALRDMAQRRQSSS